MFHEGDSGGRGGTGLKQNLVREKGWVKFVVFGLECTSPRNGEREQDVSPNSESVQRCLNIEQSRLGRETIDMKVQEWFLEQ